MEKEKISKKISHGEGLPKKMYQSCMKRGNDGQSSLMTDPDVRAISREKQKRVWGCGHQ